MTCGKCHRSKYVRCPECRKRFPMGSTSRCDNPACIEMDAPLDCVGCGRVAADSLDGVLDHEMQLIPWA